MALFLIRDGFENAKVVDKYNNRIFNTNYYSITYDLISNDGYIEKKVDNKWKLYTQIGQKIGKSRHFYFETFEMCINQLKILNRNQEIIILTQEGLIQKIRE
ncbi:MAG: hypothetical protein IPO02_11785 [Bacteroidetes bacterium]|nr:hypothetical protein [Bacteroidota bacterium]